MQFVIFFSFWQPSHLEAGQFFSSKVIFFSFWRPGLGWPGWAWHGLDSQSWGGSWPASLADLEGWAISFLKSDFFLILAAWPGLAGPGLAWPLNRGGVLGRPAEAIWRLGNFFLNFNFFLILATWPGLAWAGLGNFFPQFQFFFSFWRAGLGWPGQFFSSISIFFLILAARPGLARTGLARPGPD